MLELRKDIFISLRVWDIGGQNINSKNLTQYISNSNVIFIVYDITNIDSFNNIDDWLLNIKKYNTNKNLLIYLIGNKIDLINLRQITEKQHNSYIIDHNLNGGFFVSAKTGDNLIRSFYEVAGKSVNINLSNSELSYYDKVVKAHIMKSNDNTKSNEGRTMCADEIERMDLEAEKNKNNNCKCKCNIM